MKRNLMLALALALPGAAFAQVAEPTTEAPAEAPTEAPAEAPAEPSDEAKKEHTVDSAAGKGETHQGGDVHDTHAAGHTDPSQHFNFFNFGYRGKDAYGGIYGDGVMIDPKTNQPVMHGDEAAPEEPMSPPFVFMILNFAVLLGLLAWKGRPAMRKIARDRHDQIKTALDEAAKLREQAAAKLAEYETRLKDADSEIKKMVDGMRADAEADKKRILATAEAQANQMKKEAEQRIAAEIEYARAALTRQVTDAAIAATETILRAKETADDQTNLVNAFISNLERTPAAAPKGRV
ncbi:MAG: ATP synthase F0 subunit B [Kofleriaceae bacterium]